MKHCAAFLLVLTPVIAGAQASPEATGTVAGHVTYADTQQPARLASVVLQPVVDLHSPVLQKTTPSEYHPEGIFHLEKTGLDGTFTLTNIPQGLYYVIVEEEGYVSPLSLFTREELNHPDDATMRRMARYMTPISVTAGHTTQAEVQLIRGATIAGTVRFEDGAPVIGVGMALYQRGTDGKWKSVRTTQLASHNSCYTNDQGSYRFTGLPSGEYAVRASIELNKVITDHIWESNGATNYADGYHLQVYPGDTFRLKDTKPIKMEEGDSMNNADIDVPVSRLYSLSGTVRRTDAGFAINSAHLTLYFADDDTELTSTDVNTNDGSFRFDFVPGGSYTLTATKVADVQRTEVPTCKGCMPATRIETKDIATYGNATLPVELTGDLNSVSVIVEPAGKSQ